MRQVRQPANGWFLRLAGVALVAVLVGVGAGRAQRLNAGLVAELRQALGVPTDPMNPDELRARKETLETRIKPLRGVATLRQALMLQEWDQAGDEAIADIDQTVRGQVAQRLQDALRQNLTEGDTATRLAAITAIAEMGATVRNFAGRGSLAATLAPDLIKLADDKRTDTAVRAAAARTLGLIYADPKLVSNALARLQNSDDPSLRRAAADGLVNMMTVVVDLAKASDTKGMAATPAQAINIAALVVERAGRSVGDTDAATRRQGLNAIRLVTSQTTLAEVLRSEVETPPATGGRGGVLEDQAQYLPLARALSKQAPTVAGALRDDDTSLRLLAAQVLENIGWARRRLVHGPARLPSGTRPSAVPGTGGTRGGRGPGLGMRTTAPTSPAARQRQAVRQASYDAEEQQPAPAPPPAPRPPAGERPALGSPAAVLLQGLDKTRPALEAAMRDRDVQVRLAAIATVEALGIDAKPALPVLVRAMADQNMFVRWAAVRTVGEIGPVPDVKTVPGMVRLLEDQDVDVRTAAITALDRYGPAAADAVPALARVVNKGDAEVRVAAIHALEDIGTEDAQVMVALTEALRNNDVRVRSAAAVALGELARATPSVVQALRAALSDPEPEVRRTASEALLSLRK
jgi:HEAT repeat protein